MKPKTGPEFQSLVDYRLISNSRVEENVPGGCDGERARPSNDCQGTNVNLHYSGPNRSRLPTVSVREQLYGIRASLSLCGVKLKEVGECIVDRG
jgi:hypothetical protein